MHNLKTYTCLCGCGLTWEALKEPLPEYQYAMRSHHPDFKPQGANHWRSNDFVNRYGVVFSIGRNFWEKYE